MAAIDLLFRAKKDSERLHQLVLGTLLARTRLLARLLPLREPQRLDLAALQWEPEGNLSSSQWSATGRVLQLGRVGVLDP
jgi:hypothetical protein